MTSTSKIWKELTSILSNLNNFHSLEVVDRVSETQLQVGDNSNWVIWRLKGKPDKKDNSRDQQDKVNNLCLHLIQHLRSESDVCTRQILTSKIDPRTVRVK